jgi:hypothetical protein
MATKEITPVTGLKRVELTPATINAKNIHFYKDKQTAEKMFFSYMQEGSSTSTIALKLVPLHSGGIKSNSEFNKNRKPGEVSSDKERFTISLTYDGVEVVDKHAEFADLQFRLNDALKDDPLAQQALKCIQQMHQLDVSFMNAYAERQLRGKTGEKDTFSRWKGFVKLYWKKDPVTKLPLPDFDPRVFINVNISMFEDGSGMTFFDYRDRTHYNKVTFEDAKKLFAPGATVLVILSMNSVHNTNLGLLTLS